MSARILSMGPTTLRFARADHEIACRYFLTHLMNIGSPTLRFREAATRRQAIHARWVICNRYPKYQKIFEVGNWGKPGLPEPAAKRISPGSGSFTPYFFTPSPIFILYPAGIRYA
jgi:hypothetical protein